MCDVFPDSPHPDDGSLWTLDGLDERKEQLTGQQFSRNSLRESAAFTITACSAKQEVRDNVRCWSKSPLHITDNVVHCSAAYLFSGCGCSVCVLCVLCASQRIDLR